MEKNENGGCLPDIDLADFNHLVSLDDRGAVAFDGFMRNLAEKLTASLPDEENPLKKYRIGFYLQDRPDKSPARISSSEYRSDPADLSGRDFVVMFNREKLAAIESEDELAFILGHELSHLSWQHGNDRVRALSSNEEAACDLNAMKLLFDAGYDATVVSTMDREVPPTEEWRLRKDARRQAMNAFFDFRRPQPLDQTPWRGSRYEKWRPDFKVPSAETPEDEAVAMMVGNLQKVYVRGGRCRPRVRANVQRNKNRRRVLQNRRRGGRRILKAVFGNGRRCDAGIHRRCRDNHQHIRQGRDRCCGGSAG